MKSSLDIYDDSVHQSYQHCGSNFCLCDDIKNNYKCWRVNENCSYLDADFVGAAQWLLCTRIWYWCCTTPRGIWYPGQVFIISNGSLTINEIFGHYFWWVFFFPPLLFSPLGRVQNQVGGGKRNLGWCVSPRGWWKCPHEDAVCT